MADTGAPWNIPYQEPADIVRDYPAASEATALAIAAGLTAAGKIQQVVHVTKADTFTTSSTSFTDVTGLAATITPSADTSSIWVSIVVQSKPSASGTIIGALTVLRDSTPLIVPTSPGSRTAAMLNSPEMSATSTSALLSGFPFQILDSPATNVAITYKVQAKVQSTGTLFINRSSTDSNTDAFPRSVSTIMLFEVKA